MDRPEVSYARAATCRSRTAGSARARSTSWSYPALVTHLDLMWVLVSSTVRELTPGAGLEFADRGRHELKGLPGEWQVLAVTA